MVLSSPSTHHKYSREMFANQRTMCSFISPTQFPFQSPALEEISEFGLNTCVHLTVYTSQGNNGHHIHVEDGWSLSDYSELKWITVCWAVPAQAQSIKTHTYAKLIRSDSLSDIRITPCNPIHSYRLTNQIMTHHSYSISPNLQSFSLASQTSM